MVASRANVPTQRPPLDEFLDGFPPHIAAALRRAIRTRFRGRVQPNATGWTQLISRDAVPTNSVPAQSLINVDVPALVVSVTVKTKFTDPADHSGLIGIKLQQAQGAGYLIGESSQSFNAANLADADQPQILASPWVFIPREDMNLTVDASGLAGDALVTVGFNVIALFGIG